MKTISLKVFTLLCLISAVSWGQSHFTHSIDSFSVHSRTPPEARDFWFAVPLNYDPNDNSEKYFTVYISSKTKASVNIQIIGQTVLNKQLNPGEVWDYAISKTAELKGSSSIEKNKAVHVWSDADISVFFMSRNPFTSDGFMVIPTYFWDTAYVVASYSALIVDPRFDLPSEFCVVANQNNTIVTITPSQNIRESADPKKIQYPKSVPFTVTLQRGECIQYQTVFDLAGSDLDLTGTVVKSNKAIGVIGASVCPFIPSDPYCDHICEMLLPVSRWGKTYYTLPFYGKVVGGDSYYVVGSKPNQSIFRNGNQYGTVGQFEPYFRSDITEPSVWTSDAPFMLIQYINSSRTDGSTQNQGDPAMVQINPAEFGQKEVLLQTPYIPPGSNQKPFTHYVNILAPSSAMASIKYNGKPLFQDTSVRQYAIPGSTWSGARVRKAAIGVHTITCDSPLIAYAYGYATEESYAWSVLGSDIPIVPVTDSTPPSYTISDSCNCFTVSLTEQASRIMEIRADSLLNMNITIDPTLGPSGKKVTYYKLCGESSANGYAEIVAIDSLGNSITVETRYKPHLTTFSESSYLEYTVPAGKKTCWIYVITNLTGDTLRSYVLDMLGKGTYTITSGGMNDTLLPLPPYETMPFEVCFLADTVGSLDTLLFSYDSCELNYVVIKTIIESSDVADQPAGMGFRILNTLIHDKKVKIKRNTLESGSIQLYDILGKLRSTEELMQGQGRIELILPPGIESGAYILRFESNGFRQSQVIQVIN